MQDDFYLIALNGWKDAAQPYLIQEEKGKKNKVAPDFVLDKKKYVAELIPPHLIISHFYSDDLEQVLKLKSDLSIIELEMDDLADEHGGESGLLEEAKNNKDKLTKASINSRLKDIENDVDVSDEISILNQYLELINQQSKTSEILKNTENSLLDKVVSKYSKLSEDEIKALVVEDKWIAALAFSIQTELEGVSQTLAGRIRELAERYAFTLPEIRGRVDSLSASVAEHLKKMGFEWK